MAMHELRDRARSFGEDAEAYDRARPTYPPALIEELVRAGPAAVLDVGCGTGKVGRLLAGRGCTVVGIEPDERMAAVARRHGLTVEVAPFETWDDAGRRFDLVAAGQAWHWIDQQEGARRAAELLTPGGRLAVFWNLGTHDEAMRAALGVAYAEHFPENVGGGSLGVIAGELRALPGVDDTGAFEPQELRTYRWTQPHTREEWLDQLATHSDHRLLPADQRARLLAAVGDTIDGLGGTLTLTYETRLLTAVRR